MRINLLENAREGLRSIKSNKLRTTLTALIIAIGITALVGILTAIDGIQNSVDSNLRELGASSFDIYQKGVSGRGRRRGISDNVYKEITFAEAKRYKERLGAKGNVAISAYISYAVEVKAGSKKTNPNSYLRGVNENFIANKGYNLLWGRSFSGSELESGTPVAVIGEEIATKLFDKDFENKTIVAQGEKLKVIGVLKSTGGMMGTGGGGRAVLLPLNKGVSMVSARKLNFDINTVVVDKIQIENIIGEAAGIMRLVRRDGVGKDPSFEIRRSESMASSMDEVTGSLRAAGFGIGFITLLGAAIGLMNIMMVSVTERTKEIGIRKALGATPSLIQQQFLMEAVVICQIGGAAGIVLGIVMGNSVSHVMGATGFVIPWAWMLLGVVVCVVVGIGSGYYPAYKASKLDPIESLRFE